MRAMLKSRRNIVLPAEMFKTKYLSFAFLIVVLFTNERQ